MNNIARARLLYLKNSSHDIWGGIGLEAFGADFELVKQLPATHVWTVVDGGDIADQWILTGIHTVNRVCYLATEAPHDWQEIEFRIPARVKKGVRNLLGVVVDNQMPPHMIPLMSKKK